MSWLPAEPARRSLDENLWAAPELVELDLSRCLYAVIDEAIGDTLGLLLYDWPRLDTQGRVRFAIGDEEAGAVSRKGWAAFVAERRVTVLADGSIVRAGDNPQLARRPAAVGDAFALETPDNWRERLNRDRQAIEEIAAVYDITALARDLAKTSFFSAVAPTLQPEEVERLIEREVQNEQTV